MIVVDTNVVSEPLRPAPDDRVLAWLDEQAPETLYLTAITVAELLAGVAALPAGRRRTRLARVVTDDVLPMFEGRVLAFDLAAAQAYATVHARSRAEGLPIGFADGAIASIALAHGMSIATRNVQDFRGSGVRLIDPWASPGR